MPKHEYLHGNYFCHTGSHLECNLEFLNLLNGNKMTSTGSINIIKIANKLFGHFRRNLFQVLRFSLVLATILDATFTVYILLYLFLCTINSAFKYK